MTIRSKAIRIGILISALIVTVIIMVQLFWLQKVYLYEEKQFNINITKSIRGLYDDMELVNDVSDNMQKEIENPSPDIYLFRIDCVPNVDSLSINIKDEFADFNIYTDCQVGIYNNLSNSYIFQNYIDLPDSYYGHNLNSNLPVYSRDHSYILFFFPHRSQYIIKQMLFWIISGGILLLVLIGFSVSVMYLYRQKFLIETQKDFVNNFTHEFKTPLSVIKIAAEVLQQSDIAEKPDRLKNYADIINEQTSHLQAQVERLLQIAYTDRSYLPLQKEKIDINELIKQAINDLQPLIERKNCTLTTSFGIQNKLLLADKSYTLLAVINLIENAIKFSANPVINVSTKEEGNYFCISVADNGIGIKKEDQKRVFNRFYRVTQGNLHTAKGFGLGLNFVKKVIDTHNGKIEVKSSLNNGSEFILKFPTH